MIRLMLVDDHELVRIGLRSLLQAEPDLEVVAEANSTVAALACLAETEVDVAVVDIVMPGENGLALVEHIVRDYPKVKVVVLSMHADEGYVVEALRGGASGYVLKGSGAASVIEAARSAMRGDRHLSASLTEKVINGYLQTAMPRTAAATEAVRQLTNRELAIIRLLSAGVSKVDAAEQLFISVRTVETHRANAMRKLGVHNQTDLVRYAIRFGLATLDPIESPSTP
ncbi:MAG: response regulator transcription factor [Armatimonadota bacterium]